MGNIKFKKILEEAAWDHTSGKSLPTLDDVQKAYEAKRHLNERTAKATLEDAVNALTKTFGGKKLDKNYVKKYLKSIEQIARKKPMDFVKDYGDFKVADWIEDVEYNLQNEIVEGRNDSTPYTWGQINNALMSLRMPPKKILMVLSALKKQ